MIENIHRDILSVYTIQSYSVDFCKSCTFVVTSGYVVIQLDKVSTNGSDLCWNRILRPRNRNPLFVRKRVLQTGK